jgi:predicted ATPase
MKSDFCSASTSIKAATLSVLNPIESVSEYVAEKQQQQQQQQRLDFSALKVRGREQEVQRLHSIYSRVTQQQRRTKSIDLTSSASSSRHHDTSSSPAVAMIKGISGTGKSTLVKKLIQELEVQDHQSQHAKPYYFLSGKCDELSGGDPFSAIVEAVSGFAKLLVREESKEELKRIQRAVLKVLGPSEAQALTTMIPTLRNVMVATRRGAPSCSSSSNRKQEETCIDEGRMTAETEQATPSPSLSRPAMSGSKENAWNRLKYIFQTFTRAISTMERPVLMFLDDLQWCDAASLELLESLLADMDLKYFMFIGAFRSDEVHDDLTTILEKIPHKHVAMIELVDLNLPELHEFVADTLRPNQEDRMEETKALAEMIHRKTLGNILFTVQVLEELQRKGILSFSMKTMEWEWHFLNDDANMVYNLEDLVSDNVLAAITSKISSAPPLLQQVLILAAYTRSTFDFDTLHQLILSLELVGGDGSGDGPTVTDSELVKLLDDAVVDGLLYNTMGSKNYSFAHDKIQQSAYTMVPCGRDRDAFRLAVGLRLYEMGKSSSTSSGDSSSSLGVRQDDWMLFVAADHLNATADQVRNTLGEMLLIQLNLELGERAAAVAAYEIASKYLHLALDCMLQGTLTDPWDTQYETTLQIYRCLVDVELCQGHFDVGSSMGASVLQRARTAEDKLPTHISMVKALRRERKHRRSFDLSVQSLRGLKEYPRGWVGVYAGLVKDFLCVKRYFKKHSNDTILKLPFMMDERLIQTMELLGLAAYQAFLCKKKSQFLAAILRMLRLTLQHGLCGHSGVAVMGWTLFLDSLKDMEGVTRFSHLALDMLHTTKAKEQECLQLFVMANWICTWKDPHEHVFAIYHRAFQSGMESGDYENGLLSQAASYHHSYLAGHSLGQLDTKYSSLMDKLNLYRIDSVKAVTTQLWLMVQHLCGSAEELLNFTNLKAFGFVTHDGSENFQVLHGCITRMQLGVYFGNCQFSEIFIRTVSPIADLQASHSTNSVLLFFGSLTYATLARDNKKKKRSYRTKAKKYAKKLKAMCQVKGMNSWHRYLLAEAHCCAGSAKSGNSMQSKYDNAISVALKGGHGQDAALGCQLVAEYFLAMQDGILYNELARAREWTVQQYLTQARDWYLQWGAKGLVRHLETKYSKYLLPTPASVAVDDEQQSMYAISCAETFDSMDLACSKESPHSLPRIVVNRPGDDVSVISDQSAWRKASSSVSHRHKRLPAVLELD